MKRINKLFYIMLIFISHSVCMDKPMLHLSQPRPLKIYTKIKLSRSRTKSAAPNHANQIRVRHKVNAGENYPEHQNAQQATNTDTNQLTTFLHNQIITAQQTLSHSKIFSENEYHILLWHCRDILNIYAQENNNVLAPYTSGGIMLPAPYGPEVVKQSITKFLQAIESPTALSLLTSLRTTNFNF